MRGYGPNDVYGAARGLRDTFAHTRGHGRVTYDHVRFDMKDVWAMPDGVGRDQGTVNQIQARD